MQTWKEPKPTTKNHRSTKFDLQISKKKRAHKSENSNRNLAQHTTTKTYPFQQTEK